MGTVPGHLHSRPAHRRLWAVARGACRAWPRDGARLILTVDCGTHGRGRHRRRQPGRRRDHRHRSPPGRRGAAAGLCRAQPQPAGRSLGPGPSRRRRRRVPVPGGDHARAAPRGLLPQRAGARPARPARSRGARHRVRRGAAQGREPRLRGAKGSKCCGSGTIKACARSPTAARIDDGADQLHARLHPRPAHQCRRQGRRVEPRREAAGHRRRDRGARHRRQARGAQCRAQGDRGAHAGGSLRRRRSRACCRSGGGRCSFSPPRAGTRACLA